MYHTINAPHSNDGRGSATQARVFFDTIFSTQKFVMVVIHANWQGQVEPQFLLWTLKRKNFHTYVMHPAAEDTFHFPPVASSATESSECCHVSTQSDVPYTFNGAALLLGIGPTNMIKVLLKTKAKKQETLGFSSTSLRFAALSLWASCMASLSHLEIFVYSFHLGCVMHPSLVINPLGHWAFSCCILTYTHSDVYLTFY